MRDPPASRSNRRSLTFLAPMAAIAILFSATQAGATNTALNVAFEGTIAHGGPSSLSLNGDDVSRRYVGMGVPSARTFYGVGAGLDLMIYDEGVRDEPPDLLGGSLTLLRLRFASSADSASQTESLGGAPLTVSRSAETLIEAAFPVLSFGGTLSRGHFLLRAGVDDGWAFLSTTAAVRNASGALASGSVDAGSFYLRTPISACVLGQRLGGDGAIFRDGQDLCLTVTPTLYEWTFFNGASIGMRVDF